MRINAGNIISILLWILVILLFLLLVFGWILKRPNTQKWVAGKAVSYLEDKLGTKVSVDAVAVDIFDGLDLRNIYMEDEAGDTLLYAGSLKIDVRQMALLNKTIALENIELDNGFINISRETEESGYNFDYIIQRLLGADTQPEQADTSVKQETTKTSWELDIDQLIIRETDLLLADNLGGVFLSANLPYAALEMNDLSLADKILDIAAINIDNPVIIYNHAPSNRTEPKKEKPPTDKINTTGWIFKLTHWGLADGWFSLGDTRYERVRTNVVDLRNIQLSTVNWHVHDFYFGEDSLSASFEQFDFSEQSGFTLSNLVGQLHMSSKNISLTEMELTTPHSYLSDRLEVNFKSFKDFDEFDSKVKMSVNLVDGRVQLKDLAYFVPKIEDGALRDYLKQDIDVSGKLKGKLSSLRGDDLKIAFGQYSYFQGKVKLRGLPNIESTFVDLKVDRLVTAATDLKQWLKGVNLPNNFNELGRMTYQGRLTGFMNDFVSDGTLTTQIGSVSADINLKLGKMPSYSGDLTLNDFDLGVWLENTEQYGKVSFSSKVEGKGFKLDDLDFNIDGTVDHLEYNGYHYEDITINGHFGQKEFKGEFSAYDDNLGLDFKGFVNMNEELPILKFEAFADKLDLKALNLSKEDMIISGFGNLSLTGNNIDNIVGEAYFDDLLVTTNGKEILLDTVFLKSNYVEGIRSFEFNSDVLDARFLGDYSFKELGNTFKSYLQTYFPYRFDDPPPAEIAQQNIDFNIDIKDPVSLLEVWVPKLERLPKGLITGSFSSADKQLDLFASIDSLIYDGVFLSGFELKGDSDPEDFRFDFSVDSVRRDNILVPDIKGNGMIFNDSMRFNLKAANDSALNRFSVGALLYSDSDTFKLDIESTEIYIGGKKWEASTGNMAYYDRENFSIENLQLVQGEQSLRIKSGPSRNHKNYAELYAEKFDLGSVSDMLDKENLTFDGTVTGSVSAKNMFVDPKIASSFKIENTVFKEELLGDVLFSARQDSKNSDIINLSTRLKSDTLAKLDGKTASNLYNLDLKGRYYMPNSAPNVGERGTLDLKVDINTFALAFLEQLIGQNIRNTHGKGRGQLKVKGDPADLDFSGGLWVEDVGTTVSFLNTHYTFKDDSVTIKGRDISFENIAIFDKDNNEAEFNGTLYLNDFKRLSLEGLATADNFLFMNTSINDNSTFYGTAYAGGTVEFTGPFDDFNININASSNENTYIYIPISSEEYEGEEGFYSFIVYDENDGSEKENVNESTFYSNLNLLMQLAITPDAEVQIILDQQTGDILRGRGSGDLQIEYSTLGDFSMAGDYTVSEGDYLFTLQNIVAKPFEIKPGGKIRFTGDPYNAQLDLDAIYNAKASRYDLIKDLIEDNQIDAAKKRVPVDLYLNMKGELSSPDLSFRIDFPEEGLSGVDNLTRRRLDELSKQSVNEFNKQVFGLMVLNKFMPYESLGIGGGSNSILDGVNTTVSEFLSAQLSSYLDDVISSVIPDSDLNFVWRRYNETDEYSEDYRRDELKLVFTKRFLDDRISIDIGGNVDLGQGPDDNSDNIAIAGDFIVTYKITPDGKYKIKLFNISDDDIFTGRYNKVGASFSISEEFDTLSEFFDNLLDNRNLFRKNKKEKTK